MLVQNNYRYNILLKQIILNDKIINYKNNGRWGNKK